MRLGHVRRLVPIAVAVLALVGGAPDALAQDDSEVEIAVLAGLGGQYRPGQPMPIVVQLESDELVTGVLQVRSTFDDLTRDVPVELPAGTRRELVLTVAAPIFDPGPSPYRVEFVQSDGSQARVAGRTQLASNGLVAVLGTLASTAPEEVRLDGTGLSLDVVEVTPERLSTPGYLGPASILTTETTALDRLDPAAMTQVLDWVTTGGQLVVDDSTDTVAALPADWQPGPDGRARVGRGMIIAGDGRLAAGEWAALDAAPSGSGAEFWGGPVGVFEDASQSAARDAGLEGVAIGGPFALVILYALVAGPVIYLVTRQRRRTGLIWLAVPLLAVVTSAAIVTTGSSARTSTRFSHVSILETGAGPNHVYAAVGATTPGGGRVDFEIPQGTVASLGNQMFFDGTQRGRTAILGTGGGTTLSLDVPAGGYTAGRVEGPTADGDARLTVDATATGDDIEVTVTNDTRWQLEEVGVFAGRYRAGNVGDLEPGASVDVTLAPKSDIRDPYRPVAETVWPGSTGWDRPPGVDQVVAFPVLAEFDGRHGMNATPGGLVTAVGWTRDADVPSGAGAGRTGVIGRSAITGDGYQPAATQIDVVSMGSFEDFANGIPAVPMILRLIPNELPADGPIVVALPGSASKAEVRRDDAWVPADLTGTGDPFDPNMTARAAIEPGDCRTGVCYLRVHASIEGLEQGFPAEGSSR